MTTYNTDGNHGLRALEGSNPIEDIDAGFAALRDDIDPLLTPYDSGLLSARPTSTGGTPGIAGRIYRATNDMTGGPNGTLYVDHGTGWLMIGPTAPSWTNVTFLNSWTGGGVGLAYSKDSLGIVRLRGRVSHPSGSVSKVTTLPAGHRPVVVDQAWSVPLGFSDAFPTTPAGYGWCRIATTGDVTVLDEAGNSIGSKVAYLDAVSFPTW